MELIVYNYELLNALTKCEKTKNDIVRFIFDDDKLTLISIGDELTIKAEVFNIEKTNIINFAIKIKNLINILKKYDTDDKLFLHLNNNTLTLKIKKATIKLPIIDLSTLSTIRTYTYTSNINLPADKLVDFLSKTMIAAATKNVLGKFSGINIIINNNNLSTFATDSFRIAYINSDIEPTQDINIVVPLTTVNELLKIINPKTNVTVKMNNTNICFTQEGWSLESRLIAEKLPELKSFFDKVVGFNVIVDRMQLLNLIDKVSSLEADKVKLHFNNGILYLITQYDLGEIEEQMIVDTKNNFQTLLSINYLTQALRTFESNTVELIFTDEFKPMLIKDDTTLQQLILPMRQ